jgi:Protein of unknown function (DUF1214)
MGNSDTAARAAFQELLATLHDVEARYCGEEWGLADANDTADCIRSVMHTLEGALALMFETDPERPFFRPIVTRTRKMLGDNPDAIYYTAPVRADRAYRVRGNTAGAVYLSFTVELHDDEGGYSTQTSGVLRDSDFDIDANGDFELVFGGPARDRNWLALPPGAGEIVVRCYFEEPFPAAADPTRVVPLHVDPLDATGPPDPWSDASVAAGIRRVTNFVRGRTLEQPKMGERVQPEWVSTTPNRFNKPDHPGELGFSAFDAVYAMAPYLLGPDEALVVTGRWPNGRFANVALWNRFLQTFDYAHRPVSRNRANTTLEADGSFRLVVAHEDPGVPNWIDTEGRPFGMMFFRFFLPEEEVETPQCEVVPFADLRR